MGTQTDQTMTFRLHWNNALVKSWCHSIYHVLYRTIRGCNFHEFLHFLGLYSIRHRRIYRGFSIVNLRQLSDRLLCIIGIFMPMGRRRFYWIETLTRIFYQLNLFNSWMGLLDSERIYIVTTKWSVPNLVTNTWPTWWNIISEMIRPLVEHTIVKPRKMWHLSVI